MHAIQPHTQMHLILKHTTKQTVISSLTVQVFPLKYVTVQELLCFKNIRPQKNLQSHTPKKHNIKERLSRVQAGAWTVLFPYVIFTTSLPSSVPFSDEETEEQKRLSNMPEGTGNVKSEFGLRQSNVESIFPVSFPFSRLPRYGFNIMSFCVLNRENQK